MIAMEAKASIDDDTARAIFLSLETGKETAERFNVTVGLVHAIWKQLRHADATSDLKPLKRSKGRQKGRSKAPVPISPEIELFVRQNCGELTFQEMMFAIGMGRDRTRAVIKALGVKCRKGWTNQAADAATWDYEPAPLPDDEASDAPPGTPERVQVLRQRASRKVELWGPNDYARPLPRCEGKIEAPQMENVS